MRLPLFSGPRIPGPRITKAACIWIQISLVLIKHSIVFYFWLFRKKWNEPELKTELILKTQFGPNIVSSRAISLKILCAEIVFICGMSKLGKVILRKHWQKFQYFLLSFINLLKLIFINKVTSTSKKRHSRLKREMCTVLHSLLWARKK